ncbi:hypothetical protein YC2023_000469 [Brassica napus]
MVHGSKRLRQTSGDKEDPRSIDYAFMISHALTFFVSCWGFGYRHIIFGGDIFTAINLLNSQETNLKIKTISHTISLWNNCCEEIEFRHKK